MYFISDKYYPGQRVSLIKLMSEKSILVLNFKSQKTFSIAEKNVKNDPFVIP